MNKKQLIIAGCGVIVLLSLLFLKSNESGNVSSLVNAKNQSLTANDWAYTRTANNIEGDNMNSIINKKYNIMFVVTILGTILLMLFVSKDKNKYQKVEVMQKKLVVGTNKLKTQLSALETLKNEGVLTEEEYSKKRSQIISNTTI